MKKLFALFILTLVVSGGLFAQVRAGNTVWVAAKSVNLKSSTWFFAGTRGTLQLGDEVTVIQTKGNHAEVRSAAAPSLTGWAAMSALSTRRTGASGTGASASEIALAGKGFSKEVEDAYRSEEDLNNAYAAVDRTEAITVSQDELYEFVVDGRLFAGEEE